MNNTHIQAAKTYIQTYKKELIIGSSVIAGLLALIIVIALFIYNTTPKIVYQPAEACSLFTEAEAQTLLGNKALKSGENNPTQSANIATSQCGYTDGNPDTTNMIVAAVAVRSGINDNGVQQNKTEFAAGKPSKGVETVKDLGDGAYFNQVRGQLNVLKGHDWIILSYGIGSSPEANTLDKAIELAHVVLK